MGILSKLVGGDLIGKVGEIVDNVTTSREERIKAETDFYRAETERIEATQKERIAEIQSERDINLGQIDVNKEEAKHSNIFIAGWRPAVGWICALGLAWHFFLAEFIHWIYIICGGIAEFPDLASVESLIYLLGGILGLGAARTVEKIKGMDGSTNQFKRRKK